MNEIQVFTSIPFEMLVKAIAKELEPVIIKAVQESVPDDMITSKEAAEILNTTPVTMSAWIKDNVLTNYSAGTQRPMLSRREVVELRKKVVNGRLNRKEFTHA